MLKELLYSHARKDLAVEALHELGNIFFYKQDASSAYRHWNEALDTLLDLKNSLIQWRKEFFDEKSKSIDSASILDRCGVWGALLGGVLAAKMAQ